MYLNFTSSNFVIYPKKIYATHEYFLIHCYAYYIQLSRREGWDPINRFDPTTLLCLSQAWTWISNIICHGLNMFSEFS